MTLTPLAALLVLASMAVSGATYHVVDGWHLPDPTATPGDTLPVDAARVCAKGYAKSVRNVLPGEKRTVYAMYHVTAKPNVCCEVDHLISLELGGSNEITNLWPQPWREARIKDHLENHLHQLVCTHRLPLPMAQQCIATNWVQCAKSHAVPLR